jgi:hypothetical protein
VHHVGVPLLEHRGDHADLFAMGDVAQLLPIQPGAGGTLCRGVGAQRVEVGALRRGQLVAVLEQRAAQTLEIWVGLAAPCPRQTTLGRRHGTCRK